MTTHTHVENGRVAELPYLRPRDVLSRLLQDYPWLLLGGLDVGPEAHQVLSTFWETYKVEHPTHKVFELAQGHQLDLSWTIPLMIHGDGGRTVKKQPFEVISLVAVLGLDMNKNLNCKCPQTFCYSKDRDCRDPLLQKLNNTNNSYLSHFLLSGFPSKKFRKTPGLLKSILRAIAEDVAHCATAGLHVDGNDKPWHIAIIGLRGDCEWHAKTGVMNRSYQNVGHRNAIACCHLCAAGSPGIAFEDFRSNATWKATVALNSVPWTEDPPYVDIPFEDWSSGEAANFFRYDPFHVFRLGIARNFSASSIILLCNEGFYDSLNDSTAVAERLNRAWCSFCLWCETVGKSPASIRGFTKEKFHYTTTRSFPFAGCKGADTVLLLKYLKRFTGLQRVSGDRSEAVRLINLGCEQGLRFGGIHRHGLWLTSPCRDELIDAAKGFCHTYSHLANLCLGRRWTLYGLVPKAHALAHIYFALEVSKSRQNALTLNPGVWDTSSSEDFIGKVSRQSRRVGYRNIIGNTLLAYKIKAKFVIKRHKTARS